MEGSLVYSFFFFGGGGVSKDTWFSLLMYCAFVYARSGVNQMWILKNSKELLENLNILCLRSGDLSRLIRPCSFAEFVKLIGWLHLRPAREYFTHMDMAPLPMKG